jgi:TetR/AcrR family transcriptional repressor of nem operon
VSITDIMADAGLTHGGFYKHFSAKEDLYEVAVLQFIRAEMPEEWQRRHVHPTADGPAMARMILEAYLSDEHFADREASCPMIALPSDVSRGNSRVRSAFRQVLEMMVSAFAPNLRPSERPARERALALVSMLVGAMVLARSVDDPELASELRQSARREAFSAAGWN